jgi:hypothetical protein
MIKDTIYATCSVSVKVRPGVPDAEIFGRDAKILMTRSPRPRGKNDGRTNLKCLASRVHRICIPLNSLSIMCSVSSVSVFDYL